MANKTKKHSKILLSFFALVFIVIIGTVLQLTNVVHFISSPKPKVSVTSPPIHTLKTKSNPSVKVPSTSNGISQGTSTNISSPSSVSVSTPSSSWITSSSGLLTVKQPVDNNLVQSGFKLVGSSSDGNVQYTLIDSVAGMVSQGSINVINGNFAANIYFKSYGNTGRLDVYNTTSNGKEINLVEIPLNF